MGPQRVCVATFSPREGRVATRCHFTGNERPAGTWPSPSPAAVGSWRHPGDTSGSEGPRAGQQPGGVGQAGRRGANSRSRLWVLGAQARLWLLSHQSFLGLHCCLDSPVGEGTAQPGRITWATRGQLGPCLPQGVGAPPRGSGTERLVACSGPGPVRGPAVPLAPSVGTSVWLGCDFRGACLAPLGPIVSWGSSASWAASVPLEELGEISLMFLRCQSWDRILLGPPPPL